MCIYIFTDLTHSSVLAWRILGTGQPGGLPSLGSHRVGHDWSDLAATELINDLKLDFHVKQITDYGLEIKALSLESQFERDYFPFFFFK